MAQEMHLTVDAYQVPEKIVKASGNSGPCVCAERVGRSEGQGYVA
jgi:hypothetical protein